MNFCYITFRSVTPAQRGERLLRRAGVECSIQRTPRWMEEQGCGYSLRLRHRDLLQAVELIRDGEVPFRKVYLKGEGGSFEEIEV